MVGTIEHFNISLAVLEAYLPTYFSGASSLYQRSGEEKRNSNPHPEPSQEVTDIIKQRLEMDIEFYDFVKQRLFKQWKKIMENISTESLESIV